MCNACIIQTLPESNMKRICFLVILMFAAIPHRYFTAAVLVIRLLVDNNQPPLFRNTFSCSKPLMPLIRKDSLPYLQRNKNPGLATEAGVLGPNAAVRSTWL